MLLWYRVVAGLTLNTHTHTHTSIHIHNHCNTYNEINHAILYFNSSVVRAMEHSCRISGTMKMLQSGLRTHFLQIASGHVSTSSINERKRFILNHGPACGRIQWLHRCCIWQQIVGKSITEHCEECMSESVFLHTLTGALFIFNTHFFIFLHVTLSYYPECHNLFLYHRQSRGITLYNKQLVWIFSTF